MRDTLTVPPGSAASSSASRSAKAARGEGEALPVASSSGDHTKIMKLAKAAKAVNRKPTLRDVPAVTRAVAILRFLADSQGTLSLHEIARPLEIIPSTCMHILRVLVAEGLVSFDPLNKRYALSAGLLTLARPLLRADSMGQIAQPALDRAAREFKVTTALVQIIELKHFIVVAVSRGEGIRLQIDVGVRSPALISATGRCVAAFGGYPLSEIEPAFHALRWDNPPTWASWTKEVEQTRQRGYGIDQGHYIRGMTAIAAPLFDSHGVLRYCMTAVGMTQQIARTNDAAIGNKLLALVSEIAPPRHNGPNGPNGHNLPAGYSGRSRPAMQGSRTI